MNVDVVRMRKKLNRERIHSHFNKNT